MPAANECRATTANRHSSYDTEGSRIHTHTRGERGERGERRLSLSDRQTDRDSDKERHK
jgi:hypothetical protein